MMFTPPEAIRRVDEPQGRPSPIEFEMAYQARVAGDRIRFAIKYIEQSTQCSELVREVSLQLLDALNRFDELTATFKCGLEWAFYRQARMGRRPEFCTESIKGLADTKGSSRRSEGWGSGFDAPCRLAV